jgi:hypothetical protein
VVNYVYTLTEGVLALYNVQEGKQNMRKNTLCMTVKCADGTSVEVHMLNPGDSIPHFGGSKHSLVAHKTASIVTRTQTSMSREDYERDVYDPDFWRWIARLINGEVKEITAETP